MADNKEALPEPVGFGLMIRPNATATAEDFMLVPGLAGYTADQMHAFREAGVSELRAEVERLRVDAERLDWIERNREAVETHWTVHAIGLPDTFHGFNVRPCDEAQLSLRAAIDTARSAASGESAEGGV